MTLPFWGSLQKSMDDSSTIEDAIASYIAAHEADPEAHQGEGESLEMHRAEPVIDHPPGSLLPDKISFSDLSFDTTYESLGGFSKTTHVTNSSWPGVTIEFYDGGADTETLKANMVSLLPSGTLNKTIVFDTYFYADYAGTDWDAYAGICNNAMTTWHLGFKIDGGQLKGYARWSGSEHVTSSLLTLTPGALVFVRVYYDEEGGVIYFYVNGEQVATLQPAAVVSSDNQLAYKLIANSEESGIFRIFRTTLSISF